MNVCIKTNMEQQIKDIRCFITISIRKNIQMCIAACIKDGIDTLIKKKYEMRYIICYNSAYKKNINCLIVKRYSCKKNIE